MGQTEKAAIRILNIAIPVMNGMLLSISFFIFFCGVFLWIGSFFFDTLAVALGKKLQEDSAKLGLKQEVTGKVELHTFESNLGMIFIIFAVISIAAGIFSYAVWFFNVCVCGGAWLFFLPIVIVNGVLFISLFALISESYEDTPEDNLLLSYYVDALKEYKGLESTDANSKAWSALMSYYNCCGLHGHEDFRDLQYWPPKKIGDNPIGEVMKTPLVCCKRKTTDYTCATHPTKANNWYNKGCFKTIRDTLLTNSFVTGTAFVYLMLQGCFILATLAVGILSLMDG